MFSDQELARANLTHLKGCCLKLIYVIIDGVGDLPVEELKNKTPLAAAIKPNMNFLAKKGRTGLMYTVERGVAPESDGG